MINLSPKAKANKKLKKKARKPAPVSQAAPQRDDGLTPEDIAEINMFSAAVAKMNWEADKRRWAKIVATAKIKPKAKHKA